MQIGLCMSSCDVVDRTDTMEYYIHPFVAFAHGSFFWLPSAGQRSPHQFNLMPFILFYFILFYSILLYCWRANLNPFISFSLSLIIKNTAMWRRDGNDWLPLVEYIYLTISQLKYLLGELHVTNRHLHKEFICWFYDIK